MGSTPSPNSSEIIAKEIYGADGIEVKPEAQELIDRYRKQVGSTPSPTPQVEIIAKEIYGADGIEVKPEAQEQIDRYRKQVGSTPSPTPQIEIIAKRYMVLMVLKLNQRPRNRLIDTENR